MSRYASTLLAILTAALSLWPGDAAAQRSTARDEGGGVVAMRMHACGEGQVADAATILGGGWRRFAQEVVGEGLLLDYRILIRTWGDEWNLVEFYLAVDEDAFRYAYEEIELRYAVTDTNRAEMTRFTTLCPRRKDNLYDVFPGPR